jgi:hypothetical protein
MPNAASIAIPKILDIFFKGAGATVDAFNFACCSFKNATGENFRSVNGEFEGLKLLLLL